jgi:ubiquinone/menaquinone biosynthesis C-methylase UbiE
MSSFMSRLFAKYYDKGMRRLEENCLQAWRRNLLADASGEVLEIGAGTGANLGLYPDTVQSLVLAEPNPAMRGLLNERVVRFGDMRVCLNSSVTEELDFPDASFDSVVSTLVLCSVDDQVRSLRAIARVLKPGGRLFFLEHVRARTSGVVLLQYLRNPIQRVFGCNCHLTRDTGAAIRRAGFESVDYLDLDFLSEPVHERRFIIGEARLSS